MILFKYRDGTEVGAWSFFLGCRESRSGYLFHLYSARAALRTFVQQGAWRNREQQTRNLARERFE